MKDSEVKKLILVALAPNIQENYKNIFMLWKISKINDLREYYVASDLKMINILLGLMSHASMHPCSWCIADKNNLHRSGRFYTTLGNI